MAIIRGCKNITKWLCPLHVFLDGEQNMNTHYTRDLTIVLYNNARQIIVVDY